jgi:putative addiction module killer protein
MYSQYTLRHYLTGDGRDVIIAWMKGLQDRQAVTRVIARLDRVRHGNFGDHKPVADGVWELRIDYGPGYRVYYCIDGANIVLLLCGGDKSTQQTDIQTAVAHKIHYERRAGNV